MTLPHVTFKWQEATCELEFVEVHEPEPVVLRCGCCGLPWARLENGALVVESRHSGQVHVNRLSVEALAALVAGNGATGATNGETWGYSG